MDLIYVIAGDQGVPDNPDAGIAANAPVAIWERHPDHPDGEVFVAGPGIVQVAVTDAVAARLTNGVLVRVRKDGRPYVSRPAADEPPPDPGSPPPDGGQTPPPDGGQTPPPDGGQTPTP